MSDTGNDNDKPSCTKSPFWNCCKDRPPTREGTYLLAATTPDGFISYTMQSWVRKYVREHVYNESTEKLVYRDRFLEKFLWGYELCDGYGYPKPLYWMEVPNLPHPYDN